MMDWVWFFPSAGFQSWYMGEAKAERWNARFRTLLPFAGEWPLWTVVPDLQVTGASLGVEARCPGGGLFRGADLGQRLEQCNDLGLSGAGVGRRRA